MTVQHENSFGWHSTVPLYRTSLAPLTDQYQLTMAQAYWKQGLAERQAIFCSSFRQNPFDGGYTVACGLASIIDLLQDFRFDSALLSFLAEQQGNDGRALFDPGFLKYLEQLHLSCDIDALPEGTVVFPFEPLLRVRGPLLQAQLFETAILNSLNYQSLVATKAARIKLAADGDPVVEFALRRAQCPDGGLSASRAAFIGGCVGTSNVLAAQLFGIPLKGTHAHSFVMCFSSELEAFEAYAEASSNNCLFLVDTYDTLQGVRHAAEVGKKLQERGHKFVGIRLDSGDLAYLSIEARKILDEAGFPEALIFASNDLDEYLITSLKREQGAQIQAWGVGTNIVQGVLGGVYKLGALQDESGNWLYRVKHSEQRIKVSVPGCLQVRRYVDGQGMFIADQIYDELRQAAQLGDCVLSPFEDWQAKKIPQTAQAIDLLEPIFRNGELVYSLPSLAEAQKLATAQLQALHPGVKRLLNPHSYPAGLSPQLHELRRQLMAEMLKLDS